MIFLKILEDENLKEALDNVLSGTIDHDKFIPSAFIELMSKINEIIYPSELDGEYYVLLSALTKVSNIVKETPGYEAHLTKKLFMSIVQSNTSNLILNKDINIEYVLEDEGLNTELNTPESRQIAAQCLNDRCVDLYDKLFDMEVDTQSSIQYVSALIESLKRHCAMNSLYAQSKILSEGLFFNRKIYKGYEGWKEFTTVTTSELNDRIENMTSNTSINIDSVAKGMGILRNLVKYNTPIASYGLKELDEVTSICARSLVVIVAKEGTGKTKYMTHSIARLLLEGRKVLIYRGETPEPVTYASILSCYIFYKEKVVISKEQIIEIVKVIDSGDFNNVDVRDDMLKLLTTTIKDLADRDLIQIEERLDYHRCFDQLVDKYNVRKFDGLFIDHSCDMDGSLGNLGDDVTALSGGLKRFRDKFDTYVQILSQPSATCYESIARGKRIEDSPTRLSKTLSHDADEIYVLWDNPSLREKSIICMDNYKLRGNGKINRLLKFRTKFSVSGFISDATLSGEDDKNGSVDDVTNAIDETFGSNLTDNSGDLNLVY